MSRSIKKGPFIEKSLYSRVVDMNKGYGKMYQGRLYRFCSRNCLDKFDQEPDKYINLPNTDKEAHHD